MFGLVIAYAIALYFERRDDAIIEQIRKKHQEELEQYKLSLKKSVK